MNEKVNVGMKRVRANRFIFNKYVLKLYAVFKYLEKHSYRVM